MSGGERAPAPAYVELHCHSHYSFLDGASRPGELLDQARELGYDVLALTDHDGLYGAMEFARAAQDRRMRAITGAEITVEVADGDEHRRHHLLLLCEDRQGYANLCRLLSHAHLTHEKGAPAVDPETLSRHSRGLIALSGCPQGEVPWLIAAGRQAEAAAAAGRYREMFGPQHFFLELQRNLVYGDAARNRGLQAIARRLGLGVVATNDVHYHVRARSRLQDALVAIRHRTTLDESHALRRPNSEFYLKSPQEMAQLFADCPQALATTRRIAERCRFDLAVHLDYRFPDYPCPEGETPDTFLRRLCLAALRRLYQGTERQQAQRRLDRELGLVKKHGLAGFFLIYHELMELAKEVAREVYGDTHPGRPPGRGRGSSVGSLICYLIGLSHIDPLKNRLFVGRFLNDELASVPDVDLDFSREVREKLILRVYERYGHERVGLVCSFPTYRLRLAVRDLGKVLRLPAAMLDRLARLAEHRAADGLEEEMARYAEFRPLLEAPLWRELVALSKEIAGFPRHISQHVGGMVIASQPLVELVPLEPARMPGRVICQWDKDSIDDARMVKVDFLALGMLSLVDYCLAEIAAQDGEVVDLSRIDFNDQQVYDTICAGDTIGIFQVESRAQAQTLPRTRPRSLQDLTVQVAIVRPGPILGRAVNPYILRRQGKEAVIYDHVLLKPLLKETLGVILYQEQVIQVPMRLAGFSAGRADQFRRAMSRKRSEDAMGAFEDEFLQGARVHGVDEATGKRIFAKLMGFAEYGFPKSHAAAFALLAYQSAWLRTYHPVEFTCALFNAQPMGFYPPEVLVGDARRHNIQILRPEINRSRWRCTVERVPPRCARSSEFQVPGSELAVASELGTPNSELRTRNSRRQAGGTLNSKEPRDRVVRLGFAYVDGLGPQAGQAIERVRDEGGPFRSLFDFFERTRLSREAIENLITCGAFDDFGLQRRELLWQLGLIYRPAGRLSEARQAVLPLPTEQDMVPLPPLSAWQRTIDDYAILQLSPDVHPMAFLRQRLTGGRPPIIPIKALAETADDTRVRIAGLVVCRQRPQTASGFLFMVLEDETELANVVVRPWVYERYRALARTQPCIIVEGLLQRRDDVTNVIAIKLRPLELPGELPAPEGHNFH